MKIAFIVFLFLLFSNLAAASSGLTISPPSLEVQLLPDEKEKNFEVQVKNDSNNQAQLSLSLVDFGPLDESGGVAFAGTMVGEWQTDYALSAWLYLEVNALTLAAGETAQVKVTLLNKESLTPGGHYAGLLVKSEDLNEASGSAELIDQGNVGVNQIISSLFFVKKIGGERESLIFKQNPLTDYYFFTLPKKLYLRFQNAGNIHLVPRGIVTLRDPLKRIVAEGIINPESSIILPSTFRQYPQTLEARAQAFLPGKYTLEVNYRYDGEEGFEKIVFNFIFIGWPMIFATLFLFVILFISLKIFHKKIRQN